MTLRWKDANFLAGIALACLGIYILHTASRWTLFNVEGPGPGFFPVGYGLLMLGLSLVLIYQRVTAPVDTRPRPAATVEDRSGSVAALLSWVAIIASVPLMWLLGFVIGFGLFILFIVKVVFGRSWRTSLVTAAAIIAGLYIVFPVLLSAPLPVGRFWSF
jgi:putative tricarboxylic transport membrane protein